MTTFKDFLRGDPYKEIQELCQPFLTQSKGLPLYRGYGGTLKSFAGMRTVAVRKDRQPRDTSLYVHGLLDAYFQEKFGVKVRSEGLFCTGDRETAERYGKANYIFPIGEFKFVWGTHRGDPVSDTLRWTRQIESMMKVRKSTEGRLVTTQVMDEIDWHSDNLMKAIDSGAEIALLVDQVILVPFNDKVPYSKITGG